MDIKSNIIKHLSNDQLENDELINFINNDLHNDWLRRFYSSFEKLKKSGQHNTIKKLFFDENGNLTIIADGGSTLLK